MSLEPVQLDDLQWSELTRAARDRIAAASQGDWTLHAPVDPGVTLIELFASQIEQRSYWLDQPDDARTRALLALLEVKPHETKAARTVLVFGQDSESETTPSYPIVRDGSVVEFEEPDRRKPPLRFTTWSTVTLFPVAISASQGQRSRPQILIPQVMPVTDGVEFSLARQRTDGICFLEHPWSRNHTMVGQFVIWLRKPLPDREDDDVLSLFFEMLTPDGVVPQWSDDRSPGTDKLNPASAEEKTHEDDKLIWQYLSGVTGQFEDFDAAAIRDGTLGFRRSGLIRLPVPRDESSTLWQAGIPAFRNDEVAYPYSFRVRIENASFSFQPRILRIVPNAVIAWNRYPAHATQRHFEQPENVPEWLPLAGNQLDLNSEDGPPFADSVTLELTELDEDIHTWNAVPDLSFHGPGDRVFEVDRERRLLSFGNGLQGRIPRLSSSTDNPIETIAFDAGGGTAANFDNSRLCQVVSNNPKDDLPAVNVVAASGGEEAETLTEAFQRAQGELLEPTRAVTAEDYQSLALKTPRSAVGRAIPRVGFHPDFPCIPFPAAVTVVVVPSLPAVLMEPGAAACGDDLQALQPDRSMLRSVYRWLDRHRLLTTELYVVGPAYREVTLEVDVIGVPYQPDDTRQSISDALYKFLHPLTGGEDRRGWELGSPIQPSALVRIAQSVLTDDLFVAQVAIGLEGTVRSATLSRRDRLDTAQSAAAPASEQACREVELAPLELVALRDVAVRFTRDSNQKGALS